MLKTHPTPPDYIFPFGPNSGLTEETDMTFSSPFNFMIVNHAVAHGQLKQIYKWNLPASTGNYASGSFITISLKSLGPS